MIYVLLSIFMSRLLLNQYNLLLGKATSIRSVRRVTQALCKLAPRVIQWPTGRRLEEIKQGFSEFRAFPGIIGAIDGTFITIPAPKENPEAYVNRKGHHSIQAQVHCFFILNFIIAYKELNIIVFYYRWFAIICVFSPTYMWGM